MQFQNVGSGQKGFIIRRGEVKKGVRELVKNIRDVFYPYTGMNIQVAPTQQETGNIKVKEIKKSCAIFGINSLITLTSTEKSN